MQRFTYPVTLTADENDGGFVVTCRDVPEVVTQGETIEDAISSAEGALEAAIEMRIEDGMDIPIPSAKKRGEHLAGLPVGTAMKAALFVSMQEQNVSKAELARRLGLDEKEARRMLDPKHGTKVPALERALHALGKRVELVVV
ncbi:MAG: type II toxin-antitoxin system HicB family antitoxin [Betaproteobacteria bacterium]|nr:type II toxin-antitoxin system HicB family antitoxin [Betaproteobacteria bacterium]